MYEDTKQDQKMQTKAKAKDINKFAQEEESKKILAATR
jgi:hypothetical protein